MLTKNFSVKSINETDGELRFSAAFLVQQWSDENGHKFETKGRTTSVRVKKQTEKSIREGGRTFKGTSGRISKDGKVGCWDFDHRGRKICV